MEHSAWFSLGILQYGPLPWKWSVSVFFLSPKKFVLSEAQNVLKKGNFIFFYHNYNNSFFFFFSDVNYLLDILTQKKQQLEAVSDTSTCIWYLYAIRRPASIGDSNVPLSHLLFHVKLD